MSATASPSASGPLALYLTGFAAFVGLYLPQPILPLLAQDFGVSVQAASLVISATIFGIALASPIVGIASDRLGRRPILITGSVLLALATLGCAAAPGFGALLGARLLQGLLLPGLFAVGVAYLADSLPTRTMGTVAGIYVAATVVGGMLGRVLAGVFADGPGWRWGFVLSAVLYALLAALWWRLPRLPPADGAAAARRSWGATVRGTWSHLGNRSILAGLAIGFCLFFAFQATFTYLPFRLERPPFSFSSTLIGLTYLTYAAGVLSSGVAGWFRQATSLRIGFVTGFALAIAGNVLALAPGLPVVLVGLLVLCLGNFLVQGLAVGYVATAAPGDRAGANALYLTLYYLGGSLGAYLPGHLFVSFGFAAVVGTSIVALGLGLTGAALLTERAPARTPRGRS